MEKLFYIQNEKVFYQKRELTQLDVDSFEVVYILKYLKDHNLKAYLKDKKGIWWFEEKRKIMQFITKDAPAFKVIENDENYATDSRHVFHYGQKIPNSNAASFVSFAEVNPYYAKDKNQVYCYADYIGKVEIVKDADAKTFLPCGWSQYGTDRHNLFHFYDFVKMTNAEKYKDDHHRTLPKNWNELIIRSVFDKTFDLRNLYPEHKDHWWGKEYPFHPKDAKLIQPSRSERHFYTENAVFYKGDDGEPNLLNKLTRNYTSVLNKTYCLWHRNDEKAVFYKQFRIKEADVDSFQVLHDKIAKDKNRIYYGRQPVEGADVVTFQVLINSYDNSIFVAKDKNHIYTEVFARPEKFSAPDYLLKPVKNIDASRFEFIGKNWATDGKTVFCKMKPIPQIDVKTFRLLFSDDVNEWAVDKNHLYNANGIKTYDKIDGNSFVTLNYFWAKDKNHVFSFYTGRILKSADAKTFKVLDFDGKAQDKNYIYWIDKTGFSIKKKKRK